MKVSVVSAPPQKQLISEAPTGKDSSVQSEVSKPMKKKPLASQKKVSKYCIFI